jgi:hypothetical protein
MDPGMTDNALNPVLFARGFKIIFIETNTHFYGVVVKYLSQGTKIQMPEGTNSALDGIK